MSERDVIERTGDHPITVDSLYRELIRLGVQPGTTMLVHSSLSALGWVCGGPVAVLQALDQALGAAGTLVMPAHSGHLSDPAKWENPPVPSEWWETIRETMPAYESDATPTCWMGVIAATFRSLPGVRRSAHPQVSFAARGPQAEAIVTGHELEYSLGETSPLARLYELDG